MPETVTVSRLGQGGDGIVDAPGGPLYVAGALPGETVAIEREGSRGRLLAVVRPSPDRAEPFCPYVGRCGGCVAQHLAPGLYAGWKRAGVVAALARAGLEETVLPLLDAHGAGRRRIVLHLRHENGRWAAGFMEPRSHRLVPIETCPVTEPALGTVSRIALALASAGIPSGKPLDLAATASEAGLDLDLRGSGRLAEPARLALVERAVALGVARLSLHGEVLMERRPPVIRVGRAAVVPPPGSFLQATRAGEEALAAAVVEGAGGARTVADLFSGIGPFSLRLAERADVHAVEQDGHALVALDRAARTAAGLRRVTTERRDLFRRPLLPPELDRYEAVVLDPPRAGAEAQVRQLVLSSQETVILVSCDPGTFARDAAILRDGGFAMGPVLPVDQFKWSAHVELVAAFRRPRRRARRR